MIWYWLRELGSDMDKPSVLVVMSSGVDGLADGWVAVCMKSSDETVMDEIGRKQKIGSRHAIFSNAKTELNTISGANRQ
jgi:hypothetical protein